MLLLLSLGKGAFRYSPQNAFTRRPSNQPSSPLQVQREAETTRKRLWASMLRAGELQSGSGRREACMGTIAGRPRIAYVIIHPHPHNEAL